MRSLCWNFSLRRLLPVAVAALFAVTGCIKDEYSTVYVGPDDPDTKEYVEMSVSTEIAPAFDYQEETKASMLNNVEGRKTGALLLVYRSGTKVLDSYRYYTAAEIANAASSPLKITVPKTKVDVFLLGNLHGINRTDASQAVDLMTAYGDAFPMTEAALEALVYRLDGGDINTTYRRENMSEVATYGLPFLCVEKEVNIAGLPATATLPQGKATYLFSKISLTIDHKLFDGGDAAKVAYFVNKSVYLRQANVGLHPFSTTGFKAQEAADLSTATNAADYDAAMSNANKGTYVFYVPENMQGTASGISSGDQKNNSNASIPATLRSYGTFLEFNGTLDSSAGGFGGNVKYQFFLGANNTTDFNLERGKQYNVTLEFTAGNLFGSPNWKVNPELTDSRKFWITADEANTTDIQTVNASRTLAVRKSRPGKFYLYMNPTNLGSNNYLKGKAHEKPADFVMDDMADCAWFGNLMVPGTEDYNWLANRGITASWDSATARLTFTVTDQTKFGAATLGETREFTVKLLPDLGGAIESKFKIKLVDDLVLNVADGKSLSDEFYLGQKRTVTVTGFSGTDIRYAAIQPDCGPKTGNQMWKASNSATDVFPTVAGSAASPVLNPTNPTYANQKITGSLDIYAWYPNKFQSSHGWTSKPGKIVIFSEDYLNDSLEAEIVIMEPQLKKLGSHNYLPIDGNEVATEGGFFTFDGSARFNESDFDPVLRSTLLSVESVCVKDGVDWGGTFELNPITGERYIAKTTSGSNKLEDNYGAASNKWSQKSFPVTYNFALSDLFKFVVTYNTYFTMLCVKRFYTSTYGEQERKEKYGSAYQGNDTVDGLEGIFTRYLDGYCTSVRSIYNSDHSESYNSDDAYDIARDMDGEIYGMFEYSFLYGDLTNSEWVRTGSSNNYRCVNPPYDVIEPVFTIDVKESDTGNGGKVEWSYLESNQVMVHNGEPVPGGLIVPYGMQHIESKYKNKWDGREFSAGYDFFIKHNVNCQLFIGATKNRYAKLYVLPVKMIKYMMKMGSSLPDQASRHAFMKFGPFDFSSNTQHLFKASELYQKRSGLVGSLYYPTGEAQYGPWDFDVKFVGGYHEYTATKTYAPFIDKNEWSQAILNFFNPWSAPNWPNLPADLSPSSTWMDRYPYLIQSADLTSMSSAEQSGITKYISIGSVSMERKKWGNLNNYMYVAECPEGLFINTTTGF